jgi:ABC-type glycerol-3-phosphate transport system permease component
MSRTVPAATPISSSPHPTTIQYLQQVAEGYEGQIGLKVSAGTMCSVALLLAIFAFLGRYSSRGLTLGAMAS